MLRAMWVNRHPKLGEMARRLRTRFVMAAMVGCACLAGGCSPNPDKEEGLVVFAASSTADVMTTLASRYGEATGVPVRCSFAASSTLARQLVAGADADVFLAADPDWMDHAANAGAIDVASRVDLLGNSLVMVAPGGRDSAVTLDSATRIAMGDPSHVPAGRYAKVALEVLGRWDDVRDRVVPTADARAAVRFVESGEVDLGIVYASDAHAASVRVIDALPSDAQPRIAYPVAMTAAADPRARALLEYLQSDEAVAQFKVAGFTVLRRP